ncbi:MAG: hypothetical protein UHK54_07020 [Acutalibacteraceae bacterium]|nr:hypothetical protein [Acutalibacteraceae bacterium]
MADNELNYSNQNTESEEEFRPIIPEPEIHRRPIIGFKKNYPVEENPTSTHTESFAQQEFKRKVRMGIIYAFLLLAAFVFAFIITDTCIKISSEPIAQTEVADSVSEESTLS